MLHPDKVESIINRWPSENPTALRAVAEIEKAEQARLAASRKRKSKLDPIRRFVAAHRAKHKGRPTLLTRAAIVMALRRSKDEDVQAALKGQDVVNARSDRAIESMIARIDKHLPPKK